MPSIPKIIHQLWMDENIPEQFLGWQQSWRRLNPDYQYRLWTDAVIEAFVREHFPEYLETFHAYPENVSRADLGRYLILKHHGGVYADLDCECLRPLDAVLDGKSFVAGLEPEEHLGTPEMAPRGFLRLLCPSFLASVPNHPFWHEVLRHIEMHRDAEDVIDGTGPALLTRAYESYRGPDVTLLPEEVTYPLTKEDCFTGRALDIEYWEQATRSAFQVHYWVGTWWRGEKAGPPGLPRQAPVAILGDPRSGGAGELEHASVTCLMVMPRSVEASRRAIHCFLQQRHEQRELLVIGGGEVFEELMQIEDGRIRFEPTPLGISSDSARAFAIQEARGDYACWWDEAHLSDPQRIEVQLRTTAKARTGGCVMLTELQWRSGEGRLDVVRGRLGEDSLLWKGSLVPLDHAGKLVRQLQESAGLVALDMARLYCRAGDNAPPAQLVRSSYTGKRYDAVLAELGKRLPFDKTSRGWTYASV